MILAKAIADVDAACFEQIGAIDSDVLAVPTVDQDIAIKGSASHQLDNETECQNTLFLTYEPPVPSTGYATQDVFDDALEPGALYRYNGDLPQYSGADFVELKYEHQLGNMKLRAYFLVLSTDCEFAIIDENDEIVPYSLLELWQDGYIRRIDNG